MTYHFQRKTISLLLSALVLAWGIVPLGIQHAHEGGSDATHRHESGHEVAHHRHDHDADDEHHEHANQPKVSLSVDSVAHFHWQLLGIVFSMPVPEQPTDCSDGEDTFPPAVVRVMNEIVRATHAGPSFMRMLQAAICAPSADAFWRLEPIPRRLNLVASVPLCDSARFERSGVLLA